MPTQSEHPAITRLRRLHRGEAVEEVYRAFPFAAFWYESDLRVLAREYFEQEQLNEQESSDPI